MGQTLFAEKKALELKSELAVAKKINCYTRSGT